MSMSTYLAIITTVLVLTQIIRVTQNAMQLKRQIKLLETDQNQQLVRLWDKLEEALDKYLEVDYDSNR